MSEDVAADIGQHESEVANAPQEKMIPQSKVDEIVGARLARERAQMEAQFRQPQQAVGMGGMQPGFDEAALLEKATAKMQETLEMQRKAQEMEHQKARVNEIAGTYIDKMKQGPTLFEDFETVTSKFKPDKFPAIAIWAAQQDNTPAIIYDLAKNPLKLAQLNELARTDPELAVDELTKLSQSIKRNEEAVNNNVKSPQPLSKLKPSVVAGSDNGKQTVSDLRKQPWLRA